MVKRTHLHTIWAPFTVMLLLTLIVGATAYQLSAQWQQALKHTTNSIIETQLLSNIQWQLRQTHEAYKRGETAQAKELWQSAQSQVQVLESVADTPMSLQRFLADENNISQIPLILRRDYFSSSLSQMKQSLSDLQSRAQQVTLMTTLSMAALGFVLIGFTVWDLRRLFKKLAQSRDLNTQIQEGERRRIARELHDGIIQDMIALKRNYKPEKVDAIVHSIRRICHNLRPQILDDLGLESALEFLVDDLRQSAGMMVTLNIETEEETPIPPEIELSLFRIIQELLSNVRQHAEATQVTVTLIYVPSESPLVRVYVRDNGKGFDVENIREGGLGITGIRERVYQLGGDVTFSSSDGAGSTCQILFPLKQSELIL